MLGNPSSLCPLGQGMRANPITCQRTGGAQGWCCPGGVTGRAAVAPMGHCAAHALYDATPMPSSHPVSLQWVTMHPGLAAPDCGNITTVFLPQCVIFATVSTLPPPCARRPQPELRPSRNTPTGWPSPGSVAEPTPWGSPHGRAPSQQVSSLTHVSEKTLGAKSSPGAAPGPVAALPGRSCSSRY